MQHQVVSVSRSEKYIVKIKMEHHMDRNSRIAVIVTGNKIIHTDTNNFKKSLRFKKKNRKRDENSNNNNNNNNNGMRNIFKNDILFFIVTTKQ